MPNKENYDYNVVKGTFIAAFFKAISTYPVQPIRNMKILLQTSSLDKKIPALTLWKNFLSNTKLGHLSAFTGGNTVAARTFFKEIYRFGIIFACREDINNYFKNQGITSDYPGEFATALVVSTNDTAIGTPLQKISNTQLKYEEANGKRLNIPQTLKIIHQHSGILGLWKGSGKMLIYQYTSWLSFLISNRFVLNTFEKNGYDTSYNSPYFFAANALCGAITLPFILPIEVVMNRALSDYKNHEKVSFRKSIKQVIAKGGGLRGFTPNLILAGYSSAVSMSLIQLAGQQTSKSR